MKLDLASGQSPKPGFVSVDLWGNPDLVVDLESFPWMFWQGEVSEIWCSHYVEHAPDLIAFMNECHRILKPGGRMTINAPYYTSIRAHGDPDHKRLITETTWDYFSAEWRRKNKMDHTGITADFEIEGRYLVYSPEWNGKTPEELDFARKHYWNVVTDIQVKLIRR